MRENGGFGRGRGGQDNENACDARENWNARENWKVFENRLGFNPICAKHTFFATEMSREQVNKITWHKFWKICLSLFRDWEVHAGASCEDSHESFWVNSRLEH